MQEVFEQSPTAQDADVTQAPTETLEDQSQGKAKEEEQEQIRPNRAARRQKLRELKVPRRIPLLGICTVCYLPFLGKSDSRCQCKAGTSQLMFINPFA